MTAQKKKLNIVGGLTDLLVFVLFVGGAGFAGYFIGINQKLAPVQMVPPGTVEAIEYIAERAAGLRGAGNAPGQRQSPGTAPLPPLPSPVNPGSLPIQKDEPEEKSKAEAEDNPQANAPAASVEPKVSRESKTTVSVKEGAAEHSSNDARMAGVKRSQDKPAKHEAEAARTAKTGKAGKDSKDTRSALKRKYWVASSGSDYIGSSVTVVVNGQPVDNFFGPGKLVDVSRFVKRGPNRITFDSKVLDDEYNQHLGNDKFDLTLKLVSGANVREDFDSNSVLLSFKRTAADLEDGSNTLDFTAKE